MILIDSREKPDVIGPVRTYLTKNGIPSEVVPLATGDFVVLCQDGTPVCIEHKRIRDLFVSVQTGVLLDECARMLEAHERVHLLVHGQTMQASKMGETMIAPLGNKQGNSVTFHAIDNRRIVGQLSAIQRAGVVVDWWPLWGQVGHYLRHIKESYEKDEHDSHILRPRYFTFQRRTGVVGSMERLAIPGVGGAKAEALAEAFPTVRALANAGVSELKQVPGIGPKLAQNIYNFFGGEE